MRRILTWASSLDNAHLVVFTLSRESADSMLYPGSRIDIWLQKPKFRVETSNEWGSGSVVVSDGNSVLSDFQSEWEPAVMMNAKANLLDTYAVLKISPDDMSPFFLFMKGPSGLDQIAAKDSAVVLEPDRGSEHVLSIAHKKLGTERLYFHDEKGMAVLDRLEFDNLPFYRQLFKDNPDWDEPDAGRLERHEIYVAADKPARDFFVVKAPNGRVVRDERTKKG